jgi:hypothetical protein
VPEKVAVPLLVIVDMPASELPVKFKVLPTALPIVALPALLEPSKIMLLSLEKLWMVALPALLVSVKVMLPPCDSLEIVAFWALLGGLSR